MDHLPYPTNPVHPPLTVRYLCGDILASHELCRDEAGAFGKIATVLEFVDWIAQVDFDRQANSARYKIALCQAFLYFGLLREVLGDEFSLEDFVSSQDGDASTCPRYVTMQALPDKIARVRDSRTEYGEIMTAFSRDYGDRSEKLAYLIHVQSERRMLLLKAIKMSAWLIHGIEGSPEEEEDAFLVRFSLEVLAWSLMKCLPLTQELTQRMAGLPYEGKMWWDNPLILQRLASAGWCPRFRLDAQRHSPALLYFLSAMPQSGHDNCSGWECVASDINMATYETQHAAAGCACSLKGPNMDQVNSIIAGGGIPVIKLSKKCSTLNFSSNFALDHRSRVSAADVDTEIEVEVVEAKPGLSFCAISHVWADGLGNPNESSIHRCQLKYLYDTVRSCRPLDYHLENILPSTWSYKYVWEEFNTKPKNDWSPSLISGAWGRSWIRPLEWLPARNSVYLWIDTLCIPANNDELRKMAINKMALTYTMAEQTLVIDRTVSRIHFEQSSDIEVGIRLFTSPWMSRCWTYQEACLSRKFSFVLRDTMVSPNWWSRWPNSAPRDRCTTAIEKRLKYECLEWFERLPSTMALASVGEFDDFLGLALSLFVGPFWRFANAHLADTQTTNAEERFGPAGYRQAILADHYMMKRFSDLMKRGRGVASYQLTNTWNELARRKTTKPQDRHGILAALLGLSIGEVLELPEKIRMRAILKTLNRLPLDMFYTPYGSRTEMENFWIPQYPAGEMTWEDPVTVTGRCNTGQFTEWDDDWNLSVSCQPPILTKTEHFIIKKPVTLQREFFLGHNGHESITEELRYSLPNDLGDGVPLKITLHPTELTPQSRYETHVGYLLSMKWVAYGQGIGAIFAILPQQGSSGKVMVEYLIGFSFSRYPHARVTERDRNLIFVRIDEVMPAEFTYTIRTDARNWPTLKYRRLAGELLGNGAASSSLHLLMLGISFYAFTIPLFVRDLLYQPPGLKLWYLAFSPATLVVAQELLYRIEQRGGWVQKEAIVGRYNAYAQSFDLGESSGNQRKDGNVANVKNIPFRLYSSRVLTAKGILALIFVLGARRAPPSRFTQLIARFGYLLLTEISLRAVGELGWQLIGLDDPSFWAKLIPDVNKETSEMGEFLFSNWDVINSRAAKLRSASRNPLSWIFPRPERE